MTPRQRSNPPRPPPPAAEHDVIDCTCDAVFNDYVEGAPCPGSPNGNVTGLSVEDVAASAGAHGSTQGPCKLTYTCRDSSSVCECHTAVPSGEGGWVQACYNAWSSQGIFYEEVAGSGVWIRPAQSTKSLSCTYVGGALPCECVYTCANGELASATPLAACSRAGCNGFSAACGTVTDNPR